MVDLGRIGGIADPRWHADILHHQSHFSAALVNLLGFDRFFRRAGPELAGLGVEL